MSTGRLPVNLAGGRYKKPLIGLPSKLFHFTNSAGRKSLVETSVSLSVQRSILPVAASREYASPGLCALVSENARSRLLRCQRTASITPAGTLGTFCRDLDWVRKSYSTLSPF